MGGGLCKVFFAQVKGLGSSRGVGNNWAEISCGY